MLSCLPSFASHRLPQRGPAPWRPHQSFTVMAIAVLAAATMATPAAAQVVSDVTPRTAAAGTTTQVVVTGTDLAGGLRAAVSQGSVTVDEVAAEKAVLTLTLPADAGGSLGLWLCTAAGPVDPLALVIDSLPHAADNGANHTPDSAQLLSTPCCVDGVADGPEADWYRFHAAAGARLALEVQTQVLGSAMDPVIVLHDARGRQLAVADDSAVGPECQLEHVFQEEGDYLLEVRESRHAAGGRYHLRLGDFPVEVTCHPLAMERGTVARVAFSSAPSGTAIAEAATLDTVEYAVPAEELQAHVWVGLPSQALLGSRLLVSDVRELREEEAAGELAGPVGISGRLGVAGEVDTYTILAKAGEPLRIRSHTRSLNLPTLAEMRLVAADGSTIAATTPTESDEWNLEATLPADGQVQLKVKDLLGRGGHGFGYHLEISQGPGFVVSLAGDATTRKAFVVEPAAGAAFIALAIARQGYDGPIELSLAPPVAGLELLEATIPAGAKEHRVLVKASDAWDSASLAIVRLSAHAAESAGPAVAVGSLSLERAREPRVPFPAPWRDGALATGGAAPSEAFFAFDVPAAVTFARSAKGHPVGLTLKRLVEGFQGNVTLLGHTLPSGWSLATQVEKESYATTFTRPDAQGEPEQLTLVAYAEHGGRGRLASLDLPLSWIDPVTVTPAASGAWVAGRENALAFVITRSGDDPQPVTLTLSGLPEGSPVPEPVTVPAGEREARMTVMLPASATTDSLALGYEATSQFHGHPVTVQGSVPTPRIIPAPQRIEVFPPTIELASRSEVQHLVVTGYDHDGQVRDWTHDVTIQSGNPEVVVVAGAQVRGVRDGQADVVVTVGDIRQTVPVSVSGSAADRPVSFESEVLVALSKQGCSSGACHGSPSGKGLFRLSLRGFDAKIDELTLIREDYGRRLNTFEPEASLLLAKPLMQVSHGGGKQLHHDDAAYRVLRRWIAEGGQPDPDGAPRCVEIDLFPDSKRVMALTGGGQQLSVTARFADGTSRDVTELAAYESSNTSVATIDAGGWVTPHERGETVVLARFLEHIVSVPLTFLDPDPTFAWEAPASQNMIDDLVDEKLRLLQHNPSEVCSDDEFLRRVFLDVIGLLPTVDETQAFLADPSPKKREEMIDALLARDAYASYQALKWGDILRMTAKAVGDDGVYKYHRWVEDAFRTNMPYDTFAREILAAEGSTLGNPPANFYRAAATATDCVETVSQVFLGARLQCAKCHNHPFEKWTQDNYYGLAAFFDPVQRRVTQRPGEMFIYTAAGSGVVQPRTGERMKPWLPGEGNLELAANEDGRDRLVDWLVNPANPFFARIEANRIWSGCFARGIVEPIDDFRDSNPPANGPLLDALTQAFIESGYDRKALLRLILTSRTYQASVRTTDTNQSDTRCFSHQMPRLLAAEQLLDAIGQVTGVADTFAGQPASTKATQLPAPDLADVPFLEIFGQPQRSTVCACERSGDSNLGMAIAMFNGETMHAKLADESNRFRRGLAEGKSVVELIDELYLAALCRLPDETERHAATTHVATRESPADGLEDVCWALLNTDEFLFQH